MGVRIRVAHGEACRPVGSGDVKGEAKPRPPTRGACPGGGCSIGCGGEKVRCAPAAEGGKWEAPRLMESTDGSG